jgi:hypothetical protein
MEIIEDKWFRWMVVAVTCLAMNWVIVGVLCLIWAVVHINKHDGYRE